MLECHVRRRTRPASASSTAPTTAPFSASAPPRPGCPGRCRPPTRDYRQTALRDRDHPGRRTADQPRRRPPPSRSWCRGRPHRSPSRESAEVRVRVRDDDEWSEWSAPAVVEAGLLSPDDWTARFVSPREIGGHGAPAPVLTGTVELPGDIVQARLYATAHGVYVAQLNGQRVGDDELAPGWTSYQHRLRYQTYDVTDLVRPGENQLDVLLGNGWYRGRLGFQGRQRRCTATGWPLSPSSR